MRETSGRSRRVSSKLKAAAIALFAIFAFSAVTAGAANAQKTLTLSFNDSWIKVDALGDDGSFHALDPAAENPQKVDVKGNLADDGAFLAKKEDFNFPTQSIDAGEGFGTIDLNIEAIQDITGNYNEGTGVFTGQLPLRLTVAVAAMNMSCQLEPLNIPLATSGSKDFGTADAANVLSGTPFAGGTGAALGSWTDVGVENVTGPELCQIVIGGILANQGIDSFDGSIWLKGSSKVEGTNPPKDCPAGTTGTPPNCVPDTPKTPFAISKIVIKPGKATVKAGKSVKLKISVTNSGQTAGSATLALKSTNKQVKVPKSLKVSVAAGKTVTKTITVKAGKKAKGKATVTAKAAGKTGKSVVTVKKAKKKK